MAVSRFVSHKLILQALRMSLGGTLVFVQPAADVREPEPPPRYRVVNLGTIADCDVTCPKAINAAGQVVGFAYKYIPPGHAMLPLPILWSSGSAQNLVKKDDEFAQALTINSQGDIGGGSRLKSPNWPPVIWKRSGGYAPLALSENDGTIRRLLDNGTAAGYVIIGGYRRATRWNGETAIQLGKSDKTETVANDINDAGLAVGYLIPEGGMRESQWTQGERHAATWSDKVQTLLPELFDRSSKRTGYGAPTSECHAVNRKGAIVGYSDHSTGRTACRWRGGRIEELPAPKGCRTEAYAINDDGTIVGEAVERPGQSLTRRFACIWIDGVFHDLNDLIPPDSRWQLERATAMNERGMIVGYGTHKSFPKHLQRAFMLIPLSRTEMLAARRGE